MPDSASAERVAGRSRTYLSGILFSAILALALLIASTLYHRHQSLLRNHQVARHTVDSVTESLPLLLDEHRAMVSLMATLHADRLVHLLDNPDDFPLFDELNQRFAEQFPDFLSFNVSDDRAVRWVGGFGEHIGGLCRNDVNHFLHGHYRGPIMHPGPEAHHYDAIVRWQSAQRSGMLLVAFTSDLLMRTLRAKQVPGHRLLLLRRDDPGLIEISARGDRGALGDRQRMLEDEQMILQQQGAVSEVRGTGWLVADFPGRDMLQRADRAFFLQLMIILLVIPLIILAGYRMARRFQQHQRHVAEQLVVERNQADSYLNTVRAIIVSLDRDGNIRMINPYGEELLGWPEGELVGKNWFRHCLPDSESYNLALPLFQQILRGNLNGADYAEHRVLCASGEQKLIAWHNNWLRDRDGQIIGTLSAGEDIGGRRQLESTLDERTRELNQQRRYLFALIDNLPFMVWLKDGKNRYRAANRLLAERANLQVKQMVGKSDQDLWPADIAARYQAGDSEALSRGGPLLLEEQFEETDGRRSWLETFKTAVLDDQQQIIGTVGYARDITDRKQFEAAQRQALDEAQRLARLRSEFLANMSHEIRTPLNAVLGMAQVGARKHRDSASGEAFRQIVDAGQHLLAVVNDILDFSRLAAGKLTVQTRPFALRALLDHLLQTTRPRARSRGLEMSLQVADQVPAWVEGDSARLQQILVNLLSNALKFTSQGEIGLAVAYEENTCSFVVRDSGIGMTPQQLAGLFRPFEQGDGSITRHYGGTGLGLAISQHLARLMGGDIQVSSGLGEGSCFTVRLPMAAAAPAVGKQAGPDDPIAGRLAGQRILVVDDLEMNRLVLGEMLGEEGARVMLAESGAQALALLRESPQEPPQLVLMDVQMPGMDGLQTTREIHRMLPELPVIGVTANALEEEQQQCFAAGMVAHLAKPVDIDQLVDTLLQHLPSATPRSTGFLEDGAAVSTSLLEEAPSLRELVDWPALRARFSRTPNLVARMVRSVLDTQGELPGQVRQARERRDFDELARLAHGVKGMAGNLIAESLQQLALETETCNRQQQERGLELAERLADQCEQLLLEMRRESV